MENLNKQQIVLLTLLTSFVTSIATGIFTVSLMDQAPKSVVQTINRVVERTIEKVNPEGSNSAAAVATTKETVVVRDDDMVVNSVEQNKNSVVRIYRNNGGSSGQEFAGLGVVISRDGILVAGKPLYSDGIIKYSASFENGKLYNVSLLPRKEGGKFTFLKINQDPQKLETFQAIKLTDSDSLKLGQTVIAWGGQIRNSVSTGIVSSLVDWNADVSNSSSTDNVATSTPKHIAAIETNINLTDTISGGPLLTLYGDMVGIRVSLQSVTNEFYFMPANLIKAEMAELKI